MLNMRKPLVRFLALLGLVVLLALVALSMLDRSSSSIIARARSFRSRPDDLYNALSDNRKTHGLSLRANSSEMRAVYNKGTAGNLHNTKEGQGGTITIGNSTIPLNIKKGAGAARKMFQYIATSSTTATVGHELTVNHTRPAPRILCWILTDPNDLEKRTKHVRDTWAKRCDVTLFMSSAVNKQFPTIGLNVKPGRNHIAAKAKAAWKYIYQHHLNDADFFIKADPDTYIVVENLREYLSHEKADEPKFYGHRFYLASWGYTYMSGGPGLVLSREVLRRLVTKAFTLTPDCMPDGQGEDWKTAKCLSLVGGSAVDTRDKAGKERFMVFTPLAHLRGKYPDWYIQRDQDGAPKGNSCCSDYPISFHYIKAEEMYVLDYFLYRARPHGKETVQL